MDSETFKELIEEKDEVLERAKGYTKVQLMCFSEETKNEDSDAGSE